MIFKRHSYILWFAGGVLVLAMLIGENWTGTAPVPAPDAQATYDATGATSGDRIMPAASNDPVAEYSAPADDELSFDDGGTGFGNPMVSGTPDLDPSPEVYEGENYTPPSNRNEILESADQT